MAIFHAPDLPVTAFDLRPIQPGQVSIPHRYSGHVSTISRGPSLYAGSITWQPTDQADRQNLRELAVLMRGQANQLRIPLPQQYLHANAARRTAGNTVQLATQASNGRVYVRPVQTINPRSIGEFLTIGDRLYILEGYRNITDIWISPYVVPEAGAAFEGQNPYVVAQPTSPDQFSEAMRGWRSESVTLEWVEAIGSI